MLPLGFWRMYQGAPNRRSNYLSRRRAMQAIQVQKPGGPEVLTLVDLPVPKPKPNEVVVKVSAAGVNFIDVYFREGRYSTPLPFVNGQEACGIVSDVGNAVTSLKPGDRVASTTALGSAAQYTAPPSAPVSHFPES